MRVSHKHALNPSMCICFYCGKDKYEIALLGELPGDAKAPPRIIADYNPCPECAKKLAEGVTFMEVQLEPTNLPPVQGDKYPTGRYCVVETEAALAAFDLDLEKDGAVVLLETKLYQDLFKDVVK